MAFRIETGFVPVAPGPVPSFFLFCGFFAFLSSKLSGLMMGFAALLELPILIFFYSYIYKKYKQI